MWYSAKNDFGKFALKKSKRIAILALLLALTVILSVIPIRVSSATLALTLLPVLVLALTQDFLTGLLGGLVMGVTSLVMAFTVGAGSPTAPIFQNPLVSILPRLFVPVVAFSVMKGLSALAKRIRRKRSSEFSAAAEHVFEDIPAERAYDGADGSPDEDGACADGSPDEDGAGADGAGADGAQSAAGADSAKKDELPRLLQALIDGVACLAGVLTNTGLVLGMMWAIYGGKSVNDTLISPEFMTAMLSINFVIEVVLFPLITPPVIYAVRKSARK